MHKQPLKYIIQLILFNTFTDDSVHVGLDGAAVNTESTFADPYRWSYGSSKYLAGWSL